MVNRLIPKRLAGKPIGDLAMGEGVRVLGVMRGTEYISGQDEGYLLKEADRMLLLGKRPELTAFGDRL